MRLSRGTAAPVAASVAAVIILAVAFGLYFVTTEKSVVALNSSASSLQSASSAESAILVSEQSRIDCMESQISSLESEVSSHSSVTNSTSTATQEACQGSSADLLQLVNVTDSLSVPSGSGEGTLAVTVWNGANVSITAISVNATGSGLGTQNGPPVFTYQDQTVSITNALPYDGTASGSATVVSGTTGLYATYGYDFTIAITFANGSTQTQTLYVRAQI